MRDINHTPMTWYSLFVLKVPLNTKQTNKHIQGFLSYASHTDKLIT